MIANIVVARSLGRASLLLLLIGNHVFADGHPTAPNHGQGDAPKKKTVPLAEIAVAKASDALANAAEIQKDFACWSETESFVLLQDHEGPNEESIITIIAKHQENRWNTFVRKFHIVSESGSRAIWDQRLEETPANKPRTLHRRIGVLSARGRFITHLSTDPEGIPKFIHRSYDPVLDVFAAGHMRDNAISIEKIFRHALLKPENVVTAEYDAATRDLIAVWEYSKTKDSRMEVTLRFGRTTQYMPIESTYKYVWQGNERLVSKSTVQWARMQEKYWVPTVMDRVHRSLSGKTEIERRTTYLWKVGKGHPDGAPKAENGDLRLEYCKLFEQDCVDPDAQQVKMSELLEATRFLER
jgi:hypothetical protein